MRIALVASSNGLGHARRLLNLIPGVHNGTHRILLFMSNSQAEFLKDESRVIYQKYPFEIVIIGQYGIDGFHIRNYKYIEDAPEEIISLLSKSDLVLSDNSIWPAQFTDNFYLYGHFNWIDYYTMSSNEEITAREFREKFDEEKALLAKCRTWFLIKEFSLESKYRIETVEVPLPRYIGDNGTERPRGKEIWIANGTTGMNISTNIASTFNSIKLVKMESWKIHHVNVMPALVAGRPGLGTIRDCLATSTCFYSAWSGHDVELQSNVRHLDRVGLRVNLANYPNNSFQEHSLKVKEYWKNKSASPREMADFVFSKVV